MKNSFSIAVWMLAASVLIKMSIYLTGNQFTTIGEYAIFANIFVLLVGIFIGLRAHKQKILNQSSFVEDFKESMKVTANFVVLLAIFTYAYYSWIDPSFFEIRLSEQVQIAKDSGMNVEQVRQTGETILDPFFHTTITVLGFLLLGSFYSAMLCFLVRKFPGFGH